MDAGNIGVEQCPQLLNTMREYYDRSFYLTLKRVKWAARILSGFWAATLAARHRAGRFSEAKTPAKAFRYADDAEAQGNENPARGLRLLRPDCR